jgi:hypothetical protein
VPPAALGRSQAVVVSNDFLFFAERAKSKSLQLVGGLTAHAN